MAACRSPKPLVGVQVPAGMPLNENVMYNVIWKDEENIVRDKLFSNLEAALEWSKKLGIFVTIKGGEFEIVGIMGSDCVTNGKLPDGHDYTWKKRRG